MKFFSLIMIWFVVACQNTSVIDYVGGNSQQRKFLPANSSIQQLHRIKLVYDTHRGLYQSGELDILSPEWDALALVSQESTLKQMLLEAEQRYELLELRYQKLSAGHAELLPFGLAAHIQRLKNRQQFASRLRGESQSAEFDALAYLMIIEASTVLYSNAIVFLLSE